MSVDPKRVAVQVALRTLQLAGSTQSALEASYNAGLVGLDGADTPLSSIRDAVIAVEAELVGVIANDRVHPYRGLFYGRSDDLPNAARIPIESDEMKRFVGIFSGVCDSIDYMPLTEGTVQEIWRYHRNDYKTDIRKYVLASERLYHTRVGAYLEGCVWNRADALSRFDPGVHVSSVPAALEATWVARTIAFQVQEGWLMQEASYYQGFAQAGLDALRNRNTELPQLPKTESTSNPVVN